MDGQCLLDMSYFARPTISSTICPESFYITENFQEPMYDRKGSKVKELKSFYSVLLNNDDVTNNLHGQMPPPF